MITKKEIKVIVEQEIGYYLKNVGYKKSKVAADIIAKYESHTTEHNYNFSCHVNKYDVYRFIYGFSFGINKVIDILKIIDQNVPLQKTIYEINNSLMSISPGLLLNPLNIYPAYKYFSTEDELLNILKDVKSFYNEKFIPFFNLYSNVENIDNEFNRFENFYSTSWGKFPSLPFFHVTRLIVARLANNPHYDEVVERNFEALEEIWKKDGFIYDRYDETKPEVFAAKYLRDLNV